MIPKPTIEDLKNEEFYEKEIAPLLLELANKCKDRGMGFVSLVNWGKDGEVGMTAAHLKNAPLSIQLAAQLAQCGYKRTVNIDAFLLSVIRHAEEVGHDSVYLNKLGVPFHPTGKT